MTRRHPARLPKIWLMTDERMGEGLWRALHRLPRGGGVVFRHYATPSAERRRLFRRIARVARLRGLILVRAGEGPLGGGEAGTHGRRGPGLITWSAHDRREARAAMRAGAHLLFVSPVFATRSHSDALGLGPVAARRVAIATSIPTIALGGMTSTRGKQLMRAGFWGWAAIDAWLD